MHKFSRINLPTRFVCSVAAVFIFLSVHARADVPLLAPYPDARVVFSSTEPVSDYVLALGNYKKVRGMWRVDEQRLSGTLTRRTYELPDHHSARDGFDFFYRQLTQYPLRELYRCDARECGDSNSWAINHFNILQLYGLDQYQHFGSFEMTAAEQAGVYVTLYSVLRGNKRVFVQLEILQSGDRDSYKVASNPDTLLRQLFREGFTVFPRLDYHSDTEAAELAANHLDALAQALKQAPELAVAVVGHNYEALPLARQQARSARVAERVKAALVSRGVAATRLSAIGLGGLAPAGRGDSQVRVDIVRLY